MKKISREEQMMKNGGYWWHCHVDMLDYYAKDKKTANKQGYTHARFSHKGMANIWNLGKLTNCKNY